MSDHPTRHVLIAGIGNIFLGDDAFGVEVVHTLQRRALPPEVQAVDFGIRTYDLAFALAEHPDLTVLVDALPRGEAPGTLSLLELDPEELTGLQRLTTDAHSVDLVQALQMAFALGGRPNRLYLIGCEPVSVTDPAAVQAMEPQPAAPAEDFGLSAAVRLAVPRAVDRIEALVRAYLDEVQTEEPGMVNAGNEKQPL